MEQGQQPKQPCFIYQGDRRMKRIAFSILASILLLLLMPHFGNGQTSQVLKIFLSEAILDLLASEISGQIIFNNEIILTGAPWIRNPDEFRGTLHESRKMVEIAKSYGIDTIRIDRFPREGELDYPMEGEFWTLKPELKLVARLEADAALVAGGSSSVDITGDLVYVPPMNAQEREDWLKSGMGREIGGKIALMWSHPRGQEAEELDSAGLRGVISFRAQDRYFDPDQVIYSSGSYSEKDNLQFGFTISWRQWSEFLEDLEKGRTVTVRCKTKIEKYPNKIENVFAWLPGTEPEKKGIIFTGHLYEGYTKRGANDNTSGCVVQMEILRALTKLIAQGDLPQPRRTIYFLWPNEISGTYEHLAQHPGFTEKISTNINMDMVGEGLRKNNSLLTMSECTNHLPSYLDGLAQSILNYVWRTNDIVYLPDSPRSRYGQIFPNPIWEKNGSRDAFRYDIQLASGGSDHICFNNPSVAIPAIAFCAWPDQWYHADADTPDKSDPTQMRRMAFIGAAMAWTAANCTDDVLEDLLEEVSAFGYARIGERDLPQAIRTIERTDAEKLQDSVNQAVNLVSFACDREAGAVRSAEDISTGSEKAKSIISSHLKQWETYSLALRKQIQDYARFKAQLLGAKAPQEPRLSQQEKEQMERIPSLYSGVRGQKFNPAQTEEYKGFTAKNPDFFKDLKLDRTQQRTILNYINGRRSVTEIRNWVMAETGRDLDFEKLLDYLDYLEQIDWITYDR
jgi:aminopeptidase YwaD